MPLGSGSHNLSKSGGGKLILSGDNGGFVGDIAHLNGGLELRGSLGSEVILSSAATFSGYGEVASLDGTGTIILDRSLLHTEIKGTQLRLDSVLGQVGSPDENNPASGGNGTLILKEESSAPAAIRVFLPHGGDFRGVLFVPSGQDPETLVGGSSLNVYLPKAGGTVSFNGTQWEEAGDVALSWIPQDLVVGGTSQSGQILQVSVRAASGSFAQWQQQEFTEGQLTDPLVSGPQASASENGARNLLLYAMGLPLGSQLPSDLITVERTGEETLVSFPVDLSKTDLRYRLESSTDLREWKAEGVLYDSDEVGAPSPMGGRVTLSDPPINRKFFRLHIELK